MPSPYEKRLAAIRQVYPRAYMRWTDEEDAHLEQLVAAGQTIEETTAQLQRQPGAIRSRIKKRSLVHKPKRDARAKARAKDHPRGQVLVAIMNSKHDFGILKDQLWYRIPVTTAPRRWPPQWLAFYQTKVFGDEAYAVSYYGRVHDIRIVRRTELFPNEPHNPKSRRRYYQIRLQGLDQLDQPILSRRWRRIVFIPTTWDKFTRAAEINDLYDESPLEDRLWAQLRRLEIRAERQWALKLGKAWYFLDFALFCVGGPIDVETDGDTWHAERERIPEDNRRDNDLESAGWHVLRFNGRQIRESLTDYCVPKVSEMINRLDGLSDEGLVPRTFHSGTDGLALQLTLFEESTEYDPD